MMQRTFIGVDVAKDWLDIHYSDQRRSRIDNTSKATRAWPLPVQRKALGLFSRRAADTIASFVTR